jgi:hypothetical protein
MKAPRFRAGQYVEVANAALLIQGHRFVLGGHVEALPNSRGWGWGTKTEAMGWVLICESNLKLVSDDGLAPVSWADCAWRPRVEVVRNFDGRFYDVATGLDVTTAVHGRKTL